MQIHWKDGNKTVKLTKQEREALVRVENIRQTLLVLKLIEDTDTPQTILDEFSGEA